ncbi:RAD51-associated protein 2 [Hyperolius riggenbachi]|uniref:RAD51-associated protein 2 n=1 Tax=Hyperolius riggenbachi TaxID=752182 RepID=UPI0035A30019
MCDLYTEERSDTEVNHIWSGPSQCRGMLPYQQLQLGTNKSSAGATTALAPEEAIHRTSPTQNPPFVITFNYGTTSRAAEETEKQQRPYLLHNRNKQPAFLLKLVGLSTEQMILSQTDLMWENCIAAAYGALSSDGRFPCSDTIGARKSPPLLLCQSKRHFCAGGNKSAAALALSGPDFMQSSCAVKQITGRGEEDTEEELALKTKNSRPFKRKLSFTLLGTEELRAKHTIYTNTSYVPPEISKEVDDRRNSDRSNLLLSYLKNIPSSIEFQQTAIPGSVGLCSGTNSYCKEDLYSGETIIRSSTRYIDIQPKDNKTLFGKKTQNVRHEKTLMDSSFDEPSDSFTSAFYSQTDNTVDYFPPRSCSELRGLHKSQDDPEEESHCVKIKGDIGINVHDSLPCVTSNVTVKNINEPTNKLFFKQVECEKWLINAPMLDTLQKFDLSKPYTNDGCFGNNKPFLSKEATFPAQLNSQGELAQNYFLPDISSSVFPASSLGTPRNNVSCLLSSSSEITVKTEPFHRKSNKSRSVFLQHESVKAEQGEAEAVLGREMITKRTGSAHLDYQTALKNQGFCSSSQVSSAVDTEHLEQAMRGKIMDAHRMRLCPNQVSFAERFETICLETYMMELEGVNPTETSTSFHKEYLFCQKTNIYDNSDRIENGFRESLSMETRYNDQPNVSNPIHKVDEEELQSLTPGKEMFHDNSVSHTLFCEQVKPNSTNQENPENISGLEVGRNLKLNDSSNKTIGPDVLPLSYDVIDGLLPDAALNMVTKQECDKVSELPVDRSEARPSEKCEQRNYMATSANNSPDCNAVGDVVGMNTEEPGGITPPVFEMKTQFDLVLEELKLFHAIEINNTDSHTEKDKKQEEHIGNPPEGLPDATVHLPRDSEMEDYSCQVIKKDGDSLLNGKNLTQASEQEVPQACWSASDGDEASLYSAVSEGDTGKTFSWTPSFSFSSYGQKSTMSDTECGVTFSHGIGRVTPLKTRSGPLRIGLSRKAKIKQLHPYLH